MAVIYIEIPQCVRKVLFPDEYGEQIKLICLDRKTAFPVIKT